MTERILSPLLAFMLLAGGTVAIGSELFRAPPPATNVAELATVQLPRVEVTGRRAAAAVAIASLPRVEVTGRRTAEAVRFVETETARAQLCTTEEAAAASGSNPAAHI